MYSGCSVAALALIGATTASAQSAQTASPNSAADGAAAQQTGNAGSNSSSAAASITSAQEIVVTGSRTIRTGAAAPTPVTTISSQALLQTAPSNIADALNRLPQFLGSSSQYHSATFNATTGLQGNYLNLRDLGPQRVLVLLDGTRIPPTSQTNAVDTNILPQMLIERVDVVTGGASAAYGSDAVSGVVNYVLNKKFKGVELQAQRGVSTYGDAPSYRLGLAAGTDFAQGKGHFEFSVEHYRNDGIRSQADRPLSFDRALMVGNGTQGNPYTQVKNATFNDITFGGLIRSGPLAGNAFNPDGSLYRFQPGTPTGTSNVVVGGQGAYVPPTVLVPQLETTQAFARASYEFTDSISGFVQGSYGRSKTGYLSAFDTRRAGTSAGITIAANNPYLSPAVAAALGGQSFGLSRLFSDGPGDRQTSLTQSYNIQAGLNGKLGALRWDVEYTHGQSQLDLEQTEQNNRNFYAAVDAVRAPNGQIVCGVTLRNPTLLPGCVPLNVLGTGNLDPAAMNFIYQTSRSRITNRLDSIDINLRGNLFNLPAGPVAFAIGGEARWQKLLETSNADPAVAVDYTGISGVPTGVLPFISTNVGAAAGQQTVKEAYAELNVPLLKDVPFARNLELNGAFRYTDYKTSGGAKTWKIGGVYEPVKGVRFRSTVSRDIAAPSLFNLFAGQQAQSAVNSDPLTGMASTSNIISTGNPALKPETANTLVAGLVLSPGFIPRLTVSIDAYRISITNAIGSQSTQDELNDCYASKGTAPVCALIIRPTPTSFPSTILVQPQNLASVMTKGIDFEVNYGIPVPGLLGAGDSRFDLRAFASYLGSYKTRASLTSPLIERAGDVLATATTAGLPKWRGMLQESYHGNGFTVQLTERFTGSYLRTTPIEYLDAAYVHAPNVVYTDLYVSKDIGGRTKFTIFGQVDNLFNAQPPELPATVNPGFVYPTDKSLYDVLGRYFTVGVKMRY
jgi:outer membrane receptor protein involved in Fe transport